MMVKKLTSNDSDLSKGREWEPEATQIAAQDALTGDYENRNTPHSWAVSGISGGAQWYYRYNTATAGTGQDVTKEGEIATESICPKGWMLPLGGPHAYEDKGFNKLMNAYGVNGSNALSILPNEPFYMRRTGTIGIDEDGTAAVRLLSDGYLMSSVGRDGENLYVFIFNHAAASGLQGFGRKNGFPVRCVAR